MIHGEKTHPTMSVRLRIASAAVAVATMAVFLLASRSAWATDTPVVSHEDYREVSEFLDGIRESFSPERFHYVGIGGTSDPLLALHEVDGFASNSVPLSIRWLKQDPEHDSSLELRLFDHFDTFLPRSKKHLLVMDLVFSGRSMRRLVPLLDRYGSVRRPSEKRTMLAYAYGRNLAESEIITQSNGKMKALNSPANCAFPYRAVMSEFKDRGLRRYPSWDVSKWDPARSETEPPPSIESAAFRAMKEAFRGYRTAEHPPARMPRARRASDPRS